MTSRDRDLAGGALARYVPDLGRARDAGLRLEVGGLLGLFDHDLLAREDGWIRLAAVRVHARVLSRSVRELREAIPVAHARRAMPEVPALGADARALVPNGEGAIGPCSNCSYEPGRLPCSACHGTGRIEVAMPMGTAIPEVCRACNGGKRIVCTRCEGDGRVWVGPVLEIDDRSAELRHVYAPEVSLALQEALGAMIEEEPLPAALAVSLEPRVVDPYRGTLAGHVLAGHAFDAVMPMVRTAIHGLGGEGQVMRSEIALHAWPFLFARASGIEAAIAIDHAGLVRCLSAPAE